MRNKVEEDLTEKNFIGDMKHWIEISGGLLGFMEQTPTPSRFGGKKKKKYLLFSLVWKDFPELHASTL